MSVKSPFPGMDPWLEQFWGDVHQALVTYARDAIVEHLPSGVSARMQEQIYETQGPRSSFIEIIDVRTSSRVITVIEVLSLTNKLPGKGQDAYRNKQRELIDGGVSLVEIDLLRSGQRVLSVDRIPESHRTTYQMCVRRRCRPLEAEVYRVHIREPLPTIRIPLRPTDADVPLNLQAILDMAYRNGGYEDTDYKRDPVPPLEKADAEWADELLRSKGRR